MSKGSLVKLIKNDLALLKKIIDLMKSENYTEDNMSDKIRSYITRYNEISSLTDKMRYHMKMHLEKHRSELWTTYIYQLYPKILIEKRFR